MSDIVKCVTKSIEEISGHKIIKSNEELIRSGIIDSFGILQLIMTLEAELGIKLEDHDLEAKNFASINCRNSKTRSGAEIIIKWKNTDLLKI